MRDWSDPRHTLEAALAVLRAPLGETLPRLAGVLDDVLPHRAVAMLTGDCAEQPIYAHGDAELTVEITSAELSRLSSVVDAGTPWFGEAVVAGVNRPVFAVASVPPVSAGSMLAVIPDQHTVPTAKQGSMVQLLWDLTTVHIVDLLSEAVPVYLAENRAAASERAKAVAELTGAHAATLTGLLGVLRSRTLDDAAARRTATNLAVSALMELRSTADEERAASEEAAGEAFERLSGTVGLLAMHSDVEVERVPPENGQRRLPSEVANAASVSSHWTAPSPATPCRDGAPP